MMKTLLDKMFPSQIDAIEPMVRREREMYWEEKRKVVALVEALEAVEWYYAYDNKDGHPVMLCPKCENRLGLGHKEDCQTKQALALVEGKNNDN